MSSAFALFISTKAYTEMIQSALSQSTQYVTISDYLLFILATSTLLQCTCNRGSCNNVLSKVCK